MHNFVCLLAIITALAAYANGRALFASSESFESDLFESPVLQDRPKQFDLGFRDEPEYNAELSSLAQSCAQNLSSTNTLEYPWQNLQGITWVFMSYDAHPLNDASDAKTGGAVGDNGDEQSDFAMIASVVTRGVSKRKFNNARYMGMGYELNKSRNKIYVCINFATNLDEKIN